MRIRHFTGRKAPLLAAACVVALALPAAAQRMSDNPSVPREHAQAVEAYGGLYEGPVSTYVAEVGARVAEAAGQGGRCGFHVVNSDTVNAFTSPPGCHVYVTRGLLSLINSEDELAAVLGHEVGHVAAKHAGKRQQRSVLTGLGAMVLGAVTGSGDVANIAGQFGQMNVLSYSRNQEFQSDTLAVQYLARSGYSSYALVDVLESLQGHDQLQQRLSNRQEKAAPAWAQTHPLHGDRIRRAGQAAGAGGQTPDAAPEREAPWLANIDGLLFGDDPRQGFVEDRRFVHPELGVGFEAPPGFTLTNGARAVKVEGPRGLVGQFSSAPLARGDLEAYASAVLRSLAGQAPMRMGQPEFTRINGLRTVVLPALVQGQRGVVEVTVTAYDANGAGYHFVTLAPQGGSRAFDPLTESFRMLSPREARAATSRVIRVVTVRPGDTVEGLAARMAVTDARVERFRLLNGLHAGEQLQPGRRVKLVAYAAERFTQSAPR